MTLESDSVFENFKHFLCYIAHSDNIDQLKAFIYEVNDKQYNVLSEIAFNLIEGVIELKEDTSFLDDNVDFFKKLCDKKLTFNELEEGCSLITDLVRLSLAHYALCQYNKEEQLTSDT